MRDETAVGEGGHPELLFWWRKTSNRRSFASLKMTVEG